MKLILTFLIMTSTQVLASAASDYPIVEIFLKVTSFDTKIIKAETKEHEKVTIPRRAIKRTLVANEFQKYEVSLLDWIESGNGNK